MFELFYGLLKTLELSLSYFICIFSLEQLDPGLPIYLRKKKKISNELSCFQVPG